MIQMTTKEFTEKFCDGLDTYYEEWSTGGTWCHCWDDRVFKIEPDEDVEHPGLLIADLKKYFPDVDPNSLALMYVEDTYYESDWYGGCEDFATISLPVMQLADALIKNGHLEFIDA